MNHYFGAYGTSRFVKYGKQRLVPISDNFANAERYYKELSKFYINDSLIDESPSARTVANPDLVQVVQSPAVPAVGDYYFDVTNGKRLTPSGVFNFGTNDFAIELYCWFISGSTTRQYNTLYEIGVYNAGILLRPNSGNVELWVNNTQYIANINWVQNKWYNVILQRKNGTLSLIIDEVVLISVLRTDTLNNLIAGFGYSRHADSQRFSGYLDAICVFENLAPFEAPDYSVGSRASSKITNKTLDFGLKEQKKIPFLDTYGYNEYLSPDLLYTKDKMLVWLDSSDYSTLTIEESRVKQWRDKSGNDNHFYQNTLANAPIYGRYELNASKLITVDGNYCGMNSNLVLNAPFTIMLVSRNRIGGRVVQSSTTNALMCPYRSSNAFYIGGDVRSSQLVGINEWNICTMVVPGPGLKSQLWYRGTDAAENRSHGNWGGFAIGASGYYQENPDSEILEMLVFAGTLSLTEIIELEGIVAWKYLLQNSLLNIGHKYREISPTYESRKYANEIQELESFERFVGLKKNVEAYFDDILIDEDGAPIIIAV